MRKVKVVEVFSSLQGEGIRIGKPSIFLRLFGCNLTCPGFGSDEKIENPYKTLDLMNIKRLQDIPVFPVGCDSSPSWMSRYAYLYPTLTIAEICERLLETFPFTSTFSNYDLVITGGEPLLAGNQRSILELIQFEGFPYFGGITFETNGTIKLREGLAYALQSLAHRTKSILFTVSPKLSNSGEPFSKTIVPEAVKSYGSFDIFQVVLKFVVRSASQRNEINEVVDVYRKSGCRIDEIYLMPEGIDKGTIAKVGRELVDICIETGYSYSPRLQVDLFENAWGT